jgi:hypothetical protein
MENPGEDVTVADALAEYAATDEQSEREATTDVLKATWSGEWSRFNDAEGEAFFSQNQTKLVYVPEGTESVDVRVLYSTINLVDGTAGMVTWTVDFGADGSEDQRGVLAPSPNGVSSGTINAGGHEGQYWAFGVSGNGIKLQRPSMDHNYVEVRIEYTTSVVANLGSGSGALIVDPPDLEGGYYHALSQPWSLGTPSEEYGGGTVVLPYRSYNMTVVELERGPGDGPGTSPDEGGGGSLWWAVLLLVVVVLALIIWRYRERLAVRRRLQRVRDGARALVGRVSRRPTG